MWACNLSGASTWMDVGSVKLVGLGGEIIQLPLTKLGVEFSRPSEGLGWRDS